MRRPGRAPAPIGSERGTSLVEMITVIAIMSIVLVAVYGLLASVQTADARNSERNVNVGEARLLIDDTSKDLRTAVRLTATTSPFVYAKTTDVEFTATVDSASAPVLVRMYVSATAQLVETVQQPDAGSCASTCTYTSSPPASAVASRFVAQYITNSASQPVFTYNDSTGTALSDPTSGLASTDLLKIRSVTVNYFVQHTSVFSTAAANLTTLVYLPNLDYNPSGSFSS